MSVLALLIAGGGDHGGWQVSLAFSGSLQSFEVQPPSLLRELANSWWLRFVRHHDPSQSWSNAKVVHEYAARLKREFQQWLLSPAWLPLQQLLTQFPGVSLSLAFSGLDEADELLPWDSAFPGRRIWRMAEPGAVVCTSGTAPSRKPRVLLVVGAADDLDLNADISQLGRQAAFGRIELVVLQGKQATALGLQQQLIDPKGWDALVFLGHSQQDSRGGLLQMGDGSMLSGHALEQSLRQAALHGLKLVLLNSCSGLDLAKSAARAGVAWSFCFLRSVPNQAASQVFARLMKLLAEGTELAHAISSLRQHLPYEAGVEGCDLLLTLVGLPAASEFYLPLSQRRRLLLRLRGTTALQCLSAVSVSIAAFWIQALQPWNPVNQELLDRRLQVQAIWRQLTGQETVIASGKTVGSLPVLLLDQGRLESDFGVLSTPQRVSRLALAEALERIDPNRVPVIGLDVILDERRPGTLELAAVLRDQKRRVVAGWIPNHIHADTGLMPGLRSRPLPELLQSGLDFKDIGTALMGASTPYATKPKPLQLFKSLTPDNFAVALSREPHDSIPADAIVDWSVSWDHWLRWLEPSDLEEIRAHVLLLASDGQLTEQRDLFESPTARLFTLTEQARFSRAGVGNQIPGAHVQAVLIQSLNLNHWLTPSPFPGGFPLTVAAAGSGILLSAAVANRRKRVLWVLVISASAVPASLQVAVSTALLFPWFLPALALLVTTCSRHD
jgi:hypothetical protein